MSNYFHFACVGILEQGTNEDKFQETIGNIETRVDKEKTNVDVMESVSFFRVIYPSSVP